MTHTIPSFLVHRESNQKVCAALREEIEVYHSKRLEILNRKTKKTRVKGKGAPSKKVNLNVF